MSEREDEALAGVFEEAAPPPRAGLRARALEAMARARPARAQSRFRPLAVGTGLAMILLTYALAPPSDIRSGRGMDAALAARTAEIMVAAAEEERTPARPPSPPPEEGQPGLGLVPYRARAVDFVRQRHADDPRMLMAAALLTEGDEAAAALLEEALQKGGGPAAWAAYVAKLDAAGPRYAGRVGSGNPDPENREQMAEEERRIRESGLPESPAPHEMEPLLRALAGWQRADADNALPAVLEARYLFLLHRDEESLTRWKDAASLPKVNTYLAEHLVAEARLLSRMGMPDVEAITAAPGAGEAASLFLLIAVREAARIATFQGRVARIEGRPEDAVTWWNGTIEIGRHMQESADTIIQFLVGSALTAIGAGPAWAWRSDTHSGIPGGPLLGGRLFWGPQHEFYVSQVGEAADARVRDLLVEAKVRSDLMREATRLGTIGSDRWRALRPRLLGVPMFFLLTLAIVCFAAFGTWRRRAADEATHLGWGWRAAVAVLAVVPVVAGFLVACSASRPLGFSPTGNIAAGVGLGLSCLVVVLLPLLLARSSRRPGARLATAWRGNLRETLPVVIALSGVLLLGLRITGNTMENRWVAHWYQQGPGREMAEVVEALGPRWTNPQIPPDAWRAEPAPELRRSRGGRGRAG